MVESMVWLVHHLKSINYPLKSTHFVNAPFNIEYSQLKSTNYAICHIASIFTRSLRYAQMNVSYGLVVESIVPYGLVLKSTVNQSIVQSIDDED
jgi:hypothetical protein